MMPETKVKANPNYIDSAVNLTNNVTVKELLDSLHTYQRNEAELQDKLKAAMPQDLMDAIMGCQDRIRTLRSEIEKAVEEHGSFQDVEKGECAVKMAVKHVNYDADAFEQHFPGYSPAVIDITKSVNKVGLSGLIKSGKVTEDQLKNTGVVTESETFRWVIQ